MKSVKLSFDFSDKSHLVERLTNSPSSRNSLPCSHASSPKLRSLLLFFHLLIVIHERALRQAQGERTGSRPVTPPVRAERVKA